MDVTLMKMIDRWAGVPVCLVLSFFFRVKQILRMEKHGPIQACPRILFIELSEMGSMVLARPSFEKIRELFPGAKLHFLTFDQNRECIDILNIIPGENVLTIRNDSFCTLVADTLRIIRRLRGCAVDIVVDLELFSRFTSILSCLCGARTRVGFYGYYSEGLYRGNFQTHKVAYNPYQHMSLNFLSLVHSLKHSSDEMPHLKMVFGDCNIGLPHIQFNKEVTDVVWNRLRSINPEVDNRESIVVLNPNAGNLLPVRAWPLEKYVELTRRLLENRGLFVVVTGIHSAPEDAEIICREIKSDRCMNLTCKFTLEQLLALFSISDVLVTNDSGPAQFAALTPIRNVVLFGPETPALYCPLGPNCAPIYSRFACSPCLSAFNHRTTVCRDNKCLQSIEVDHVYSIVEKSLRSD